MVSIVDFLNQRGIDSSREYRAILWQQYKPNEKYTGLPEQNTDLLQQLEQDELVPNLELISSLYEIGDVIQAKVISQVRVGIETNLGQRSFEADPEEIVNLGTVTETGSFPIRIANNLFFREGILLVYPNSDNKLLATILANGAEYDAPPEPILFEEEALNLFEKYFQGFSAEILGDSLIELFTPDWVAANIVELSTALTICGVSVGVGCAVGFSAFLGSYFLDALKLSVDKVAASQGSELTVAEAEQIKDIIGYSNVLLQFASPFIDRKAALVCNLVTGGIAAADAKVSTVEQTDDNRTYVLSARVALQESGKITALLCLKKKP